MPRKVIQIAAIPAVMDNETETTYTVWEECVYALCDDGTIWVIDTNTKNRAWEPLPQIPQ